GKAEAGASVLDYDIRRFDVRHHVLHPLDDRIERSGVAGSRDTSRTGPTAGATSARAAHCAESGGRYAIALSQGDAAIGLANIAGSDQATSDDVGHDRHPCSGLRGFLGAIIVPHETAGVDDAEQQ